MNLLGQHTFLRIIGENLLLAVVDFIKARIPAGKELHTPSGRATFVVNEISSRRIVVRTAGGTPIRIPSECFEAVMKTLPPDNWMTIGATKGDPEPGSLDALVQRFSHGVTAASYVAPILEEAGLTEIDHGRPNRIRRSVREIPG